MKGSSALRLVAPSGSTPTDGELVRRGSSGGDRAALEDLFVRHAKRMNALAFRLLGRDADVDDLVQEAFARAFASLDALRDPEAFGGWIQGILVRTALSWIRKRRVLARIGFAKESLRVDLDAVTAHVASPHEQLELRRTWIAIEAMPSDVRIELVLHRIDGMTLEEVARAMKISLATVKRKIAQGQRRLEEL